MMQSFSPSCFNSPESAERPAAICKGRHSISSAAATASASQNLTTCIYHLPDSGGNSPPSYLTLTWSKTLLGHSLTVHLLGSACTIDVSPPRLFRSKRSSRSLAHTTLFWCFAQAHFAHGPEPTKNFYLCIVSDGYVVLLLGDLPEDALRHAGFPGLPPAASMGALVSRREHVFGRRNYATTARFGRTGREHEIGIECSGGEGKDARLVVRVDGESVLTVKRLAWKFRGNQRVIVDGTTVEIFWDVYNWLFNGGGHAIFIFQAGGGGVAVGGAWSELVVKGPEKRLLKKSASSSTESANSVLQWAESVNDSGNQSGGSPNSGFSLLLYAWRSER